ncbi:MAG: hypothetical protein ACE5G0_03635 [Rhodothermales bacterium]
MFERLFKFDPLQFAEGDIGFQAGQAFFVFGVLLLFLLVGFCIVYAVTNIYTSDRTRAISLGIRIPALLLLCLPLFEPVLITPDVVPDENFVAVLVDASESMTIPDGVLGETRRDDVQQILFGEDERIIAELEALFKVRYYLFSDDALRTDSVRQARADGHETNLTAALDRVLSDFKGLPLSGIVLMTDGGDNSTEVPLNKAEELRALDIPLHIVGVGHTAFEQEREILDVAVSKGVGDATGAEIEVKVRSWVAESAPVDFNIYRGGERVFTEARMLKGNGKIDQLTFFYEPQETGAHEYTLEIAESSNELNTANNALNMLIDTRKDTLRVLYFEGHLRQELKFIKRALEDDQVVEVASISRTGTGKFYRQGIKTPDELAGGFPADVSSLYAFKAVIFGDVEAAAFSPDQLRMIEAFVRVRGGGLLMLGGRQSFAEGDYWNTPVADLLPVELDPSRRTVIPPRFSDPRRPPVEQGFRFMLTPAGLESPIMKLSPERTVNVARWAEMPGLTSINYLGAVKPGAVVLAEKPDDDFGEREPLLVTQRYGKGRSAALATAGTWRWQMLLDAEDTRHERFWQQLARWLAASAPNRVNIDMSRRRFAPNDDVPLTVNVYDEAYLPREGVEVRGLLTDPFGGIREIVFEEELTAGGTYTAPFVPQDEGVYELQVTARAGEGEIGSHTRSFLVRPSNKEFYDATLKRAFLENLADANNGFYYEPSEAGAIPANLRNRRTSTSIYRAEYLWDMPLLFGLVILLLSAEWIYRRRKGLP